MVNIIMSCNPPESIYCNRPECPTCQGTVGQARPRTFLDDWNDDMKAALNDPEVLEAMGCPRAAAARRMELDITGNAEKQSNMPITYIPDANDYTHLLFSGELSYENLQRLADSVYLDLGKTMTGFAVSYKTRRRIIATLDATTVGHDSRLGDIVIYARRDILDNVVIAEFSR